MLQDIILVFSLQVAFNIFRSLGVMATADRKVLNSVMLSVLIQLTWLYSTYLGITSLLDNNYIVVIFYVLGGSIGTYLSFKISKVKR